MVCLVGSAFRLYGPAYLSISPAVTRALRQEAGYSQGIRNVTCSADVTQSDDMLLSLLPLRWEETL